MSYRLAIIGLGTVGQGFAELLADKKDYLDSLYGLRYQVVAISDPVKGSVFDEGGLDLHQIMSLVKKDGNINAYKHGVRGWDSMKTIKESEADIIAEITPTNLDTGDPGTTFIKTALKERKHVITTNKGPIALHYRELDKLSKENNCLLKFEGTVLSGTPAINLSLLTLAGAEITEIRGIANGTTNYILTKMDEGREYVEVLKEAQRLGYAEAKPDADVEGWDALAKIVILSNVVMGADIKVADVERRGITGISQSDIQQAKNEGKRYKLVARAWKENGKVKARVTPEKVPESDSLFHITGVNNALVFTTDTLGSVTISGPGAGRIETGFSLLNDLISIHRTLEK